MSSMTHTRTDVSLEVFLGVDTHKNTHHAALVDHLGRAVGDCEFTADPDGYRQLLVWTAGAGVVVRAGVEGTGSYGAGLTRVLRAAGIVVAEVCEPDRAARRRHGKSDPVDAYAAAAAALSGRAQVVPKTRDGDVESIRLLHNVRRSAVKDRAQALTQLKSTIVSAPEPLRTQLRCLTRKKLVTTCAGLRPGSIVDGGVLAAAKLALKSLATRIRHLDTEVAACDKQLTLLTRRTAPQLLALVGVGVETASQLLCTVGDNRDRITSEASLAALCGVAPLLASSGKTNRHRLNRGGDRQANRALHVIVLSRLKHDPRSKDYMARRIAEGKSKRETIRCLKRYVAREIFGVLNPRIALDTS